jgi:geranylgeranyl diphosphate synthase, type II
VAAVCCAALAQAAGACGMVGGQADDMRGERRDERGEGHMQETPIPNPQSLIPPSSSLSPLPSPLSSLQSIHHRKTGAMIRVSLRLGAMIAGADNRQLAALDDYGRKVGLAFQITDDLLDVRSTEAATGKRVGKDAQQGKLTFPSVLGLDQSTQHAKQ